MVLFRSLSEAHCAETKRRTLPRFVSRRSLNDRGIEGSEVHDEQH